MPQLMEVRKQKKYRLMKPYGDHQVIKHIGSQMSANNIYGSRVARQVTTVLSQREHISSHTK